MIAPRGGLGDGEGVGAGVGVGTGLGVGIGVVTTGPSVISTIAPQLWS